MPELPEVETSRRGIEPHLINQTITDIVIRNGKLRWPVDKVLIQQAIGLTINKISRRAKYLLIELSDWSIMVHLGMSGSLRVVPKDTPPNKHDHIDLVLWNGLCLRYTDPRRFGCWLSSKQDRATKLLNTLGPEPLSEAFNSDWLFGQCKQRQSPIKQCIMNNQIVVGVGNIYATEALFLAGIHPSRKAASISKKRPTKLTEVIKAVIEKAITQGGTTLKDFTQADGKPGYFKQSLMVYGREGKPCVTCNKPLEKTVLGQRATVFCKYCQN